MRAVMIDDYGTPGAVRDVAVPEPGAREVLVRETVAGVNPVDWKIRAGKSSKKPLPLVLGQDFAGRVERVGADVDTFAAGDRVFGTARVHGAFAEYTIVSLDDPHLAFANLPTGVSDETAAALPTPALTALAALEILQTPLDGWIAVTGATGALGSAAVQLAKVRGLHVVAVVKGSQGEEALGFGADRAVDADGDVAAQIDAIGLFAKLHGVIDGVATDQQGLAHWASLLAPQSAMVSTNHAADVAWFEAHGLRAANVTLNDTPQSSRAGLETLLAAVRAGHLRVELGERGKLDAAPEILTRGERHELHGKAVIIID